MEADEEFILPSPSPLKSSIHLPTTTGGPSTPTLTPVQHASRPSFAVPLPRVETPHHQRRPCFPSVSLAKISPSTDADLNLNLPGVKTEPPADQSDGDDDDDRKKKKKKSLGSKRKKSHATGLTKVKQPKLAPGLGPGLAPGLGGVLGMTATEAKEMERAKKRELRRQKKLAKSEIKRKRDLARLDKHCTNKLYLKPSNIEAILAAAPVEPRHRRKISLVDLCILPLGDTIPLTKPLQYPFDCISFDGKYMLSILEVRLDRRDSPTLCRFTRVPPEDVETLLGPVGVSDPRESFLSPSLNAAAKRCYLKNANGWTTWFVMVLHEERTYRVALDRFRPSKGGPGFVPRPGMEYTEKEIEDMCALAAKSHPSTTECADKGFFSLVHSMGSHSNREVLPEFLEPILRVTPTIINPKPNQSVAYEQFLLPPVTNTFMPTFCHSAT